MSLNAELRTPPERRNAMAERRAEAMNRHVELEAGQGQSSRYSKEVTRSVELEAEQGSSSRYSKEELLNGRRNGVPVHGTRRNSTGLSTPCKSSEITPNIQTGVAQSTFSGNTGVYRRCSPWPSR